MAPRIAPATLVVLLHAVALYALLTGLGIDAHRLSDSALKIFDLPADRPPPPEPPREASRPKSAAEPAKHAGGAPPIIAVAPVLPLLAPPAPASVASGEGRGLGTGSGSGSGAGGQGSGEGGMTPARWIKGGFHNGDVPRSLRKLERVSFGVRIAIQPDGRIGACDLIESSGYPELDAVACGVMQRRFRFDPARDADGQPITEVREETEGWILDPPREGE